ESSEGQRSCPSSLVRLVKPGAPLVAIDKMLRRRPARLDEKTICSPLGEYCGMTSSERPSVSKSAPPVPSVLTRYICERKSDLSFPDSTVKSSCFPSGETASE